MVTNQASIKRNGIQDYVTIRASAAIILAYSIYMLYFFVATPIITYDVWKSLFESIFMQAFTLITLIAIMMHVRIGLWQVLTDYVKPHVLRMVLQYVLNIIAVAYVAVGLFVLWGV